MLKARASLARHTIMINIVRYLAERSVFAWRDTSIETEYCHSLLSAVPCSVYCMQLRGLSTLAIWIQCSVFRGLSTHLYEFIPQVLRVSYMKALNWESQSTPKFKQSLRMLLYKNFQYFLSEGRAVAIIKPLKQIFSHLKHFL